MILLLGRKAPDTFIVLVKIFIWFSFYEQFLYFVHTVQWHLGQEILTLSTWFKDKNRTNKDKIHYIISFILIALQNDEDNSLSGLYLFVLKSQLNYTKCTLLDWYKWSKKLPIGILGVHRRQKQKCWAQHHWLNFISVQNLHLTYDGRFRCII